jgi:hypothetical protein
VIDNTHYTQHNIQTIDLVKEWNLDPYQFSILKYIERAGRKTGASYRTDMLKAAWYAIMAASENKQIAQDAIILVSKLIMDEED